VPKILENTFELQSSCRASLGSHAEPSAVSADEKFCCHNRAEGRQLRPEVSSAVRVLFPVTAHPLVMKGTCPWYGFCLPWSDNYKYNSIPMEIFSVHSCNKNTPFYSVPLEVYCMQLNLMTPFQTLTLCNMKCSSHIATNTPIHNGYSRLSVSLVCVCVCAYASEFALLLQFVSELNKLTLK
jgi:hypothetical protein